jgi:hypothetical protein
MVPCVDEGDLLEYVMRHLGGNIRDVKLLELRINIS